MIFLFLVKRIASKYVLLVTYGLNDRLALKVYDRVLIPQGTRYIPFDPYTAIEVYNGIYRWDKKDNCLHDFPLNQSLLSFLFLVVTFFFCFGKKKSIISSVPPIYTVIRVWYKSQ